MPPPVTDIEEATQDFPLLGYTVVANVKGVEIMHHDLLQLLTPMSFASFLPPLVQPQTALKRAIRAWIKELSASRADLGMDEDEENSTNRKKNLIREINSKKSQVLILALVEENIDLEALGLSYLTNLRVFYNKKTEQLSLTTTPSGQQFLLQQGMTVQDGRLLASLIPHYERYAQLHNAGDLARVVQDIVSSMNATMMRPGGGAYFVPYSQRDQLRRLKDLIEEKLPPPSGGANTSYLLHLPIIDRESTKAQLAGAAHSAFLQELDALAKDMERFIRQAGHGKVKPESMATRLAQYQEAKRKAGLYTQVLGMRQEQILAGLQKLEQQALALLQAPVEVSDGSATAGASSQQVPASPTV